MAVTVRQYRDTARCTCKHCAGAHRRDRPGCTMCRSCRGFTPCLAERLKDATAALRAARAALKGRP